MPRLGPSPKIAKMLEFIDARELANSQELAAECHVRCGEVACRLWGSVQSKVLEMVRVPNPNPTRGHAELNAYKRGPKWDTIAQYLGNQPDQRPQQPAAERQRNIAGPVYMRQFAAWGGAKWV